MTSKFFRPEEYFVPKTIDEATSLLAKHGDKAKPYAGGTDLLVEKSPHVKCIVDIASLPIDYIEKDGGGVRIGALSNCASIMTSSLLKGGANRILAKAASELGHGGTVRNMATIGGNVCSSVPSADFPTALLVLDAKAKIVGPEGERTITIGEFFVDVRKTALKRGELLVELQVPDQPANTGTAFCKHGRVSADIALVNAAARITLGQDGTCQDARIALGAVAPTPLRARKAEDLLKGKRVDDALIEQASQTAAKETKPISDVRASAEYRRDLSRVLTKRALQEAMKRAKEG
jgi:carbon-monoxide dehydrogenase medium subunit